jgi:acetyl-CoA/propionyl-CoA carboxylase, biotin carboxylase, biotin carboxyl carrier protein
MSFSTVLVANRGEIAIRILKAARKAGLRTVAVFSDPDSSAPHVQFADSAVRIGPAPPNDSYLSIPALLEAADRAGADAVHPGYGFLSENAAFSRACGARDLTFIGPPPEVIEMLGRKDVARQMAIEAGVPVLPAIEEAGDSTVFERASEELGYPLLVKAAAGGGGKGMRIVRHPNDLAEALASARREATGAFGDGTLLIERYLEHGRHIEVQIFADNYGNVVHFFERDCSVQRRHQKIMEEAPALAISDAVRNTVTKSSTDLARHVGYVNAGTVEFIVNGESAYMLEVNTRLQVEHPVTEMVTGHDLVALQFHVAQGHPLPMQQDEIAVHGHAIEARIYAEDPEHGFLPQAGFVDYARWPQYARVDQALVSGQRIETWYDPMLGKIIVHGTDRESARLTLLDALDDSGILGPTTNLGFVRTLAHSDAFRDLAIDTATLDSDSPTFIQAGFDSARMAAALCLALHGTPSTSGCGPFQVSDGWRLGAPTVTRVPISFFEDNKTRTLYIDRPELSVVDGDRSSLVQLVDDSLDPGGIRILTLLVDGRVARFFIDVDDYRVRVVFQGKSFSFDQPGGKPSPTVDLLTSDADVLAPMPGVVTGIRVRVGQAVESGELLATLEAMKMEYSLRAPVAGVVDHVGSDLGHQVALGHLLFRVSSPAADEDD